MVLITLTFTIYLPPSLPFSLSLAVAPQRKSLQFFQPVYTHTRTYTHHLLIQLSLTLSVHCFSPPRCICPLLHGELPCILLSPLLAASSLPFQAPPTEAERPRRKAADHECRVIAPEDFGDGTRLA